ncbi:SUKH-3 domain-containing protein [Crossiella sp. CA198]|uniref:SUKH-3 domain-containing protein n=1 Tax=Crossiella sp. CA198 TaxID=3455607 RepID=UPI003F8D165F
MTEHPALVALREAGWTAGRSVDVGAELSALEADGYQVPPWAAEFLREYSGLCLPIRPNDEVHLSAARVCEQLFPEWTSEYSTRVGVPLIPIGVAETGHLALLLAEDGRWFGGFDDEFGEIGANTLAALDSLINRSPFTRRY